MAGLDDLTGGDDPWALEDTQKNIEDLLATYLLHHAKSDTKELKKIAKNIEKVLGSSDNFLKVVQKGEKTDKDEAKRDNISIKLLERMGLTLKEEQKADEADRKGKRRGGGRGGGLGGGFLENLPVVGGMLAAVGSGAKNLAKNFLSLDTNFKQFALSLPVVGFALGGLIGWISGTVDQYRELIMVGQGMSGSMFNFSIMANKAGLNMESFGKIVVTNSKLMAGVGGPRVLANMVDSVRKSGAALGFSMESITEFSVDYLDQLKISGMFDRMTDMQRSAGAKRYISELNEMAKITGRSAKELSKEQRKLAENTNVAAVTATLSGEEQAEFTKKMQALSLQVQRFGPEMGGQLMDMAATAKLYNGNFAAASDFGRTIASVGSLNTAFQGIVDAQTPDQIRNATAGFSDALINMTSAEHKRLALQAQRGNAEAKQLIQMRITAIRLNDEREDQITSLRSMGMSYDDAVKKLNKQDEATAAFLQVQQKMQGAFGEIREGIMTVLVDSKVFDKLGAATDWLTTKFSAIADWIGNWIVDVSSRFDIDKAFKGEGFSEIWDNFYAQINQVLFPKEAGVDQVTIMDKLSEYLVKGIKLIPWDDIFKTITPYIIGGLAAVLTVSAIGAALSGLAVMLGSWIATVAFPAILSGLWVAFAAVGTFILDALIIAGTGILAAIGAIPLAIIAGLVVVAASVIALFYFWDDIKAAWDANIPTWEDIKAGLPEIFKDPVGFIGKFFSSMVPDWASDAAGAVGEAAGAVSGAASSTWNWLTGGETATVTEPTGARGIQRKPITVGGSTGGTAAAVVAATESNAVAAENTNRNLERLLEAIEHQNQLLMAIADSSERSVKVEKEMVSAFARSGRLN